MNRLSTNERVRDLKHRLVGAGGARAGRRATLITLLTNLVVLAAGTLSGLLLARSLGPSGRGDLAAAQTLPMILGALSALGMGEAVAFVSASTTDESRRSAMLSAALMISGIMSVAVIAVAQLLIPIVLGGQGPDIEHAARIASLYSTGLATSLTLSGWFRGQDRIVLWNLTRAMPGALWAGATLVVVATGSTVVKASVALAIASTLSGILALSLVIATSRFSRPTVSNARELLAFGVPSASSTLPRILNNSLDVLLLIPFTSSAQLGYYAASVTWSSVVPQLGTASTASRFKIVASAPDTGRSALVSSLLRRALKHSVLAGAMVMAITPFAFVVVFGDEFNGAVGLAIAMSAVAIVQSFRNSLGHCMWASGTPRLLLASDIAGFLVTIVLVMALAPFLGVWGAVIASLCSYGASAALGRYLLMRHLSRPA